MAATKGQLTESLQKLRKIRDELDAEPTDKQINTMIYDLDQVCDDLEDKISKMPDA